VCEGERGASERERRTHTPTNSVAAVVNTVALTYIHINTRVDKQRHIDTPRQISTHRHIDHIDTHPPNYLDKHLPIIQTLTHLDKLAHIDTLIS